MSELRQKMLADLKVRNYAERTCKIYLERVAEMAQHFGRSPDRISRKEVRDYLRYLVTEREVSASAFRQIIAALRFLYRTTLGHSGMIPYLPYPRQKRRQPVVLSPDEVARLLKAIPNLKHRMVRPDGDHGSPRQGRRGPAGDPIEGAPGCAPAVLAGLQARMLALRGKGPRKAVGGLHDPARDQSGQDWGQDHKAGHLAVPSS